jgi:hypothetical protein
MTNDAAMREEDPVERLLRRLEGARADAERARRTRARCHEALRCRRSRPAESASVAVDTGVGLLALAYLTQVARLALAIVK